MLNIFLVINKYRYRHHFRFYFFSCEARVPNDRFRFARVIFSLHQFSILIFHFQFFCLVPFNLFLFIIYYTERKNNKAKPKRKGKVSDIQRRRAKWRVQFVGEFSLPITSLNQVLLSDFALQLQCSSQISDVNDFLSYRNKFYLFLSF